MYKPSLYKYFTFWGLLSQFEWLIQGSETGTSTVESHLYLIIHIFKNDSVQKMSSIFKKRVVIVTHHYQTNKHETHSSKKVNYEQHYPL